MNVSRHQVNTRQEKKAQQFQVAVRVALARQGQKVKDLVAKLRDFPRSSVSRAINQGVFPKIRARIAEELGIAA